MRKMLNKKGFTLVELMIVVVILGILVAIAVPIYSIVTENARKKTCFANMRMISGACVQYYMEHENFTDVVPCDNLKTATGLPEDFMKNFDKTGLPTCPDKEGYYILEGDGVSSTFKIKCSEHGDYHE